MIRFIPELIITSGREVIVQHVPPPVLERWHG
jgi:hypothetical protein